MKTTLIMSTGTEWFLLNLVNTYSSSFYNVYKECVEYRTGFFQFDNFRALPLAVILHFGLTEHQDFDDELMQPIYSYTPNFSA